MAESVSFKAYLKRAGQEAEVRRFGIDTGAASSFVYLRSKIQAIFPAIQNDQFSIFWHDGDDFISIDTDEELLVALTNSVQPIKLHIHVSAQPQNPGGSNYEPQTHVGVCCDGCEAGITGFRYKCVSCPDFDLCAKCESKGLHPEHIMMRLSTPLSPHMRSKFFRKMFGRPHKFMRHHGWNRGGEGCGAPPPPPLHGWNLGGEGCGAPPPPPPPPPGCCPFTRDEEPQAGPAPRVGDMFDFSALMDFINSLGVVMDDKKPAEPTVKASTSAQAFTSNEQAFGSQEQASGAQPVPGAEYLTNIGQAIQAFLDPFGVSVQFDVRPPKATEDSTPTSTAAATATAASTAATTPATASTTATPAAAPVVVNPVTTPSAPAAPVPVKPAATGAFQTPWGNPVVATEQATPALATTPAPATTPVPAAVDIWNAMMRDNYGIPARRTSDDWTLLNRESPTRGDEAMAVDGDESRGAIPKTSVTPTDTPAAATATQENQRVQEAVEKIRGMGFSIDPNVLKELLSHQDIASVLEMLLGGGNTENK